jgi:chromosome segregation ATPase
LQRSFPHAENGSFTAIIQRLESENEELTDELGRARSRSDALLVKVEEWETWAQAMEEQLKESQSLVARLDEELRHVQGGITEAVKLLQSFWHQEPHSCEREDQCCDATRSPNQDE